MTESRFEEIVRSPQWDYELGRETAKERIANHTASVYDSYPLEAVFGKEWARGFREYIQAWRVINE